MCSESKFFVISEGLIGLGSLDIERGDEVVTLKGAFTPPVLRRHEDCYTVQEEAFLYCAIEASNKIYQKAGMMKFKEYNIC